MKRFLMRVIALQVIVSIIIIGLAALFFEVFGQ
jgi:hypothetical protein